MAARSMRNGIVLFALAATLAAGCRAFHNVVGLSEPINDNTPLEPGAGVPWGDPVLVLTMRDTILAVGDTVSVTGLLYVSPVTRFSQPTGTYPDYSQPTPVYSDTTERVATGDIGIVRIDGTLITARSPGQANIVVTGLLGPYVVGSNLTIHVH
jgi:hypothetical protein